MMAVAGVGAVVNVSALFMLRRSAEKSLNMKAAYLEVMSDLLTSVAVLAGGAVMLATGWYIVDPILSAGIGVFILPRTWRLLREAVGVRISGTHLLATGELVADLTRLMEPYGFADARELVDIKRAGERVPLDADIVGRWRSRLDELFQILERARDRSVLPDDPPDPAELDAWLVSHRLGSAE
jgi:cation diffusion facilitator family transporter